MERQNCVPKRSTEVKIIQSLPDRKSQAHNGLTDCMHSVYLVSRLTANVMQKVTVNLFNGDDLVLVCAGSIRHGQSSNYTPLSPAYKSTRSQRRLLEVVSSQTL